MLRPNCKRILFLVLFLRTILSVQAQTVNFDSTVVAKAVWVAISKQNIATTSDYLPLGLALGLHAAWQSNPSLTEQEAQNLVNQTRASYELWRVSPAGKGASPEAMLEQTLNTMANIVEQQNSSTAVDISKLLISLDNYDSMESQALDEIYTDAKTSAAQERIVNGALGSDLKVLTTDTTKQMLDENPQLKQAIIDDNLYDIVNNNTGQLAQVNASLQQCFDQVNKVTSEASETLKNQNSQTEEDQESEDKQRELERAEAGCSRCRI